MEKKKIIFTVLILVFIFCWLFFVGQLDGTSALKGDINLIDEGQFGAWINHMLHGKLIYRDFFPPYGPLQVYPLYLLIKIFGPSFFVIRLFTTTIGVFLGVLIALFTLRSLKVNKMLGFFAFLFFLLYPGVHIRSWIVVLTIVLLVSSYSKKSNKLTFLSGVIVSYALLQSVEAGVFSLIILGGYILVRFLMRIDVKNDKKRLSIFVLGFALLFLPLSLFALRSGWLVEYFRSTVTFLTAVSGINLPNGQGLPNPFDGFHYSPSLSFFAKFIFSKNLLFYWTIVLFVLFQTILFIRFMLRKTTERDVMVFLIILYAFLSYFSIIGRSGHHFLFAPYIVLLASYFLSFIFPSKKKGKKEYQFFGTLFFILFLGYMARYLIIFRYTSFFDASERRTNKVERVAPISITLNQAHDIEVLRQFIRKTTKPSDTVFLFNNLPGLYFLLDRENPTKYDFPLLAISKEDRMQLVGILGQNKPIYIIEDLKAWPVDEVSDRQRLPEVVKYLNENYFFFIKIDHFLIYKKR